MVDKLTEYIDGFVFPVPRIYLSEYKNVAEKVAEIWREYGALAYYEYVGEDLNLEGTRSFVEVVDLKKDEAVVFGWVVFPISWVAEPKRTKFWLKLRFVNRTENSSKI